MLACVLCWEDDSIVSCTSGIAVLYSIVNLRAKEIFYFLLAVAPFCTWSRILRNEVTPCEEKMQNSAFSGGMLAA